MNHEKVLKQFQRDCEEHEWNIRHDPYYSHSCGSGIVPAPRCMYCSEYNGNYCMKLVNNWDETLIIQDRDERDPGDLCDDYCWNGEWEDE